MVYRIHTHDMRYDNYQVIHNGLVRKVYEVVSVTADLGIPELDGKSLYRVTFRSDSMSDMSTGGIYEVYRDWYALDTSYDSAQNCDNPKCPCKIFPTDQSELWGPSNRCSECGGHFCPYHLANHPCGTLAIVATPVKRGCDCCGNTTRTIDKKCSSCGKVNCYRCYCAGHNTCFGGSCDPGRQGYTCNHDRS